MMAEGYIIGEIYYCTNTEGGCFDFYSGTASSCAALSLRAKMSHFAMYFEARTLLYCCWYGISPCLEEAGNCPSYDNIIPKINRGAFLCNNILCFEKKRSSTCIIAW